MATYATATLVKSRLGNISAHLDAEIEDHIEEAEGIMNAIMGTDFLGTDHTFDAAKHGILRAGAIVYAAYAEILHSPDDWTNTSEAFGIADGLWQTWLFIISQLTNKAIVSYLENL